MKFSKKAIGGVVGVVGGIAAMLLGASKLFGSECAGDYTTVEGETDTTEETSEETTSEE